MPVINGTEGSDRLVGTEPSGFSQDGYDTINGLGGDDTIDGLNGYGVLNGGEGNDSITGGLSIDQIDGGPGADTMAGGGNDDSYIVDLSPVPGRPDIRGDTVIELANGGSDIIIATVSYVYIGNNFVESLRASTFNSQPINLFGIWGMKISGNELDNVLDYAGNAAFSQVQLEGYGGNDTLVVHGPLAQLFESPGGGTDTVIVDNSTSDFARYQLGRDAEVEVVTTAINSGMTGQTLLGNHFSQTIIGDYGTNLITSGGADRGPGDVLIGLRGDDTYYVDAVRVSVIEQANEGNDVIEVYLAGSDFVLNAGTSVETLRAVAGTDAINITGNPDAQRILGNDGDNILSTGGNTGFDTLVGGVGNDTYRIFGGIDTIVEAVGQGSDVVFASGNSFALNAGASVEYISTSVQADAGTFYLVGNEIGQVIVGNYGDNTLNGNSGNSGNADTMIGLVGNDTYRVNMQTDVILESAGQGSDSVLASASYQLRIGASVETLSAVAQTASDTNSQYVLRGNEVAQVVVGNDSANTIDGRGGADVLIGRGGADVFAFTSTLGGSNIDSIQDFASGTDRIGLASDTFGALAGGVAAGSFMIGTAALDGDDRILYDQATGRVFYDADANGSGTAVLFAQLSTGALLTAVDFVIIAPVGDLPA